MKHFTLIALTVALSACSSLQVEVGVLKPEVVRGRAENDRLTRSLPSIIAETDTTVGQFFVDRINVHATAYDRIREAYSTEAVKLSEDNPERALLNSAAESMTFPDQLRDNYRYWETVTLGADSSLRSLWPAYQAEVDPSERHRLRQQLLARLDERESVSENVNRLLIEDLDLTRMKERLQDLPEAIQVPLIEKIQQSVRQDLKTQRTQLFDPGGIQHSPYAYYVAKADDEDWALQFDYTKGRGTFGNTDIAIKALAPGNFTIKGVSFNPADVAATAAKVASQTVLLAAQIAGVPVKISGAPPSGQAGAALAQSSGALNDAIARNARVDQRLIAHRDALRRIAAAIVRERQVILSGTAAQRHSALEAIKAVYESHAPQLSVETN